MPDVGVPPRAAGSSIVNVPNAISFARLCAVPAAVWLVLHEDFPAAFWLFVAAGVSDALDGWAARRLGSSAVGKVLDPVADKALLVSMYVTLAVVHEIPDWLAILVVFRDLLIVGGVVVLGVTGQMVVIDPLFVSKLNTVLQIVLVALALAMPAMGWTWVLAKTALVWVVAASTLASGGGYVWFVARSR